MNHSDEYNVLSATKNSRRCSLMTDNQKNFCKDFIFLMRKYNIQRMRVGEGYVSFRKDEQDVCLYDYDSIMGLHIFFPATAILFEEDENEPQ